MTRIFSSQWTGYNCTMNVIIRDVLLAVYGEINLEMVPLLEELMKNPALIKDMVRPKNYKKKNPP